jgi:hypothetical protein
MSQQREAGAQGHARPAYENNLGQRLTSTSSAPAAEQHPESEWDVMWRKPFTYPEEGEP